MPRRIDTQAMINAVRLDEQTGDPAQPAAGFRLIYAKNDGIYEEDSAGVVVGPLGLGDITADAAWVALGDLIVGTGAGTADILSAGVDGLVLTTDSGTATGLKWAAGGSSGGADILEVQVFS
jgi:hypothetical protein